MGKGQGFGLCVGLIDYNLTVNMNITVGVVFAEGWGWFKRLGARTAVYYGNG